MMSSKKLAAVGESIISSNKKTRRVINLKTKLEILNRINSGEKSIDISRSMGLRPTTVRSIRANAAKNRSSAVAGMSSTNCVLPITRPPIMVKMEQLLFSWIQEINKKNIPIKPTIIRNKAQSLFEAMRSPEDSLKFTASPGWFKKFKKRHNLLNVGMTGEANSAHYKAAQNFLTTLKTIIDEGGYSARQVFNVDKTGLYWKCLPSRTFITEKEATAPDDSKTAKDRFNLLLGTNATGDLKLKPLIVSHEEDPRSLKKRPKNNLPIIWKSNKKTAWVTSEIFTEWFETYFCPTVKEYCSTNNISHKALLILDNAPDNLEYLNAIDENVKIVILPPKTTSILQPMNQGIIASFKAYYLRRAFNYIINEMNTTCEDDRDFSVKYIWLNFDILNAIEYVDEAWKEVSDTNINKAWDKIWPECVTTRYSYRDSNNELLKTKTGSTELNQDDILEIIPSREAALSNEKLLQIVENTDQMISEAAPDESMEEPNTCRLTVNKLYKFFEHIDKALEILEYDSDEERSERVALSLSNSVSCYEELYNEKKSDISQRTFDNFFIPSTSYDRTAISPSRNPSLVSISSTEEN